MDFDCNLNNIKDSISRAKMAGAVIRLGPELEITGYGCEDHFLELDTVTHAYFSSSLPPPQYSTILLVTIPIYFKLSFDLLFGCHLAPLLLLVFLHILTQFPDLYILNHQNSATSIILECQPGFEGGKFFLYCPYCLIYYIRVIIAWSNYVFIPYTYSVILFAIHTD